MGQEGGTLNLKLDCHGLYSLPEIAQQFRTVATEAGGSIPLCASLKGLDLLIQRVPSSSKVLRSASLLNEPLETAWSPGFSQVHQN